MIDQIQKELNEIEQQHGGILKPEHVVEFARNPETALHSRFQWDDDKAAEQYRLWQARMIIRVRVTVLPQSKNERPVRAYVSLSTDRSKEGGGYRPIATVLSDKDMREQLLADAVFEMKTFRRKYDTLKALAPVFAAMDEAIKKHEKKTPRPATQIVAAAS